MLSTSDIQKIRGHLLVKGISARTIMAEFGISASGVYQAISGECRSARIQGYIADQIGFWPYPWARGAQRRRKK